MLRNPNLIPLSRQHQHALALCVRINRASPISDGDLLAWQEEIAQQFDAEIKIHFAAEESVLFPAARGFPQLDALVGELLDDHAALREIFAGAEARALGAAELAAFAERMSAHIRKEERQLFESLQQLISPEAFSDLGGQLEAALKEAAQTCAVPTETTRLRSST